MFGFGKKQSQNEDTTEDTEMRAMTPEETEEFFEDYKQSDAYQIYSSIKDGTYQQKYGSGNKS